MFSDWELSKEDASRAALVTSERQVSWSEFLAEIESCKQAVQPFAGRRVALPLAPSVASMVRFFALVDAGVHVFLVAGDAETAEVAQWAEDFGLQATFGTDGTSQQAAKSPKQGKPEAITILTSGTTGKPKAVEHSWNSLVRPVRQTDAARGTTWLLTFRPHLYAGLQVIMQCLLNRGTLVIAAGDATEVVEIAVRGGVQYASATPSYWRWLLTLGGSELPQIPLRQITLGGEAVDQATIDALRKNFPSARLVHIYATTELGRCFSVSDGLAGFPADLLNQASADGVEMRIEEGELVVRSANAMLGYDGDDQAKTSSTWVHTGDLVEVHGDRVQFVGRMTDMINVGGNKVYPVEVETVVRSVPGVADTRVYGEASSMVGELVKCDIVIQDGFDPSAVEAAVRKTTLEQLTNYQRPRFLSIVDEIPRTAAGKVKR